RVVGAHAGAQRRRAGIDLQRAIRTNVVTARARAGDVRRRRRRAGKRDLHRPEPVGLRPRYAPLRLVENESQIIGGLEAIQHTPSMPRWSPRFQSKKSSTPRRKGDKEENEPTSPLPPLRLGVRSVSPTLPTADALWRAA